MSLFFIGFGDKSFEEVINLENVEEIKLKASENLKNRVRPLLKFGYVGDAALV